jgi:hypothetical protein
MFDAFGDCDRDRLKDAFKELRVKHDYRARTNFACCGSCGHYELANLKPPKPYVFWNRQADDAFNRSLYLEGVLYLGFGTPTLSDRQCDPALIVRVLRDHGIDAHHNGDPHKNIAILPRGWVVKDLEKYEFVEQEA